jgi:hypothetical protein
MTSAEQTTPVSARRLTGTDVKNAPKRSSDKQTAESTTGPNLIAPFAPEPRPVTSLTAHELTATSREETLTKASALIAAHLPVSKETALPALAKTNALPLPSEMEADSTAAHASVTVDAELKRTIATLWSSHQGATDRARKTREQLTTARLELSKALHAYKHRLVGSGRGGMWTPFLREIGISKTTADRYVQQHQLALNPPKKLPNGELVMTPTQLDQLAQKICYRIGGVLATEEATDIFLKALAERLKTRLSFSAKAPAD